MQVTNVIYKQTITQSSGDGNKVMMATKWEVHSGRFPRSSKKTYHIVILKSNLKKTTNIEAFLTTNIPKKVDLSRSMLHVAEDSNDSVLKDYLNNPICSFAPKDQIDLGFEIEPQEFEKVNSISEKLISQLGDFLKTHLQEKTKEHPESSPPSSSSAASSSALSADSKKAEEKPKSFLKRSILVLSNSLGFVGSKIKDQITCNRIGLVVMIAVPTLFSYYLNRDSADLSGIRSL